MFFRRLGHVLAASCLFSVGASFSYVNAQQTASAHLSNEAGDGDAAPIKRLNEKSSDKGFSTTDFLPPEERKTIAPEEDTKVDIKVVINVPHNKDTKNELTFYPYPMMPPRVKTTQKGLPEDEKQGLKNMIMTSGYTQRTMIMQAYPFGGWRWQYAFQAALRKSGLGYPHVISEMYTWVDEMMPYVKAEAKRSNEAEKERKLRYQRAKEEYDETRTDMENDSVRKGLFPVPVRMKQFSGTQTRWGGARVLPGSWWLVGTHKIAGLTYYWDVPVEIEANKPTTIELTEANALAIDGAW